MIAGASGTEGFRLFIAALGFEPPARIEPGQWARFSVNGKRDDTAGYARLFPDLEGGIVGNWRTGETWTWQAEREHARTPAELQAYRERCEKAKREAQAERERELKETAERAERIWKASQPADDSHPYLKRKSVSSHGLRLYRGSLALRGMRCDGALIVPRRTAAGDLVSLQFIGADGEKRYLNGPRPDGAYYSIGKPEGAICIAEGYATAASIHAATGHAVAVAFESANLTSAARALREKFLDARLIVCADDDWKGERQGEPYNPGLESARAAALAVGGLLAIPAFGDNRPEGATDLNDLAALLGIEAVRQCIAEAQTVQEPAGATHSTAPVSEAQPSPGNRSGAILASQWPEPRPLTVAIAPELYPLDALPESIRASVEEVQRFTKAPIPLVAGSALAAVSVVGQSLVDVRRAEQLSGPVSLFLLTIADSGERKTTCDSFFTKAIKEWLRDKAIAEEPAAQRARADFTIWKAKSEGLANAIRDSQKRGEPTAEDEAALRELETKKPKPHKFPRLMRGEDTPQKLALALMNEWPSCGVISSEGGVILGGHGMGRDSIMTTLAQYNVFWDGGHLARGRVTTESTDIRGARVTLALQIQELMLRAFFDRSEGLARGSGFLARFLIAWPDSTQGFRPFSEAPSSFPALARFNRRIADLLDIPVTLTADGGLSPLMLDFAPEAKRAWIAFADGIESGLRAGGELQDVRDVASKAADNAARLAALFHVFEHGPSGAIGLESVASAARLAAWHLNEARRFLGGVEIPAELVNASRLDAWLLDYCARGKPNDDPTAQLAPNEIQTKIVQQYGPNGIRKKDAIDQAVAELEEQGRARLSKRGQLKLIAVNPALLEGGR